MVKKIKPAPTATENEIPVSDKDKKRIAAAHGKVQELQFRLGQERSAWVKLEAQIVQAIIAAESNTAATVNAVAEKYDIEPLQAGEQPKWDFILEKGSFIRKAQ